MDGVTNALDQASTEQVVGTIATSAIVFVAVDALRQQVLLSLFGAAAPYAFMAIWLQQHQAAHPTPPSPPPDPGPGVPPPGAAIPPRAGAADDPRLQPRPAVMPTLHSTISAPLIFRGEADAGAQRRLVEMGTYFLALPRSREEADLRLSVWERHLQSASPSPYLGPNLVHLLRALLEATGRQVTYEEAERELILRLGNTWFCRASDDIELCSHSVREILSRRDDNHRLMIFYTDRNDYAWLLGTDPEMRDALTSYVGSGDPIQEFGRDDRRVVGERHVYTIHPLTPRLFRA